MRRRDFITGAILAAAPQIALAQKASTSRHSIGVASPVVPIADMIENAKTSDLYPGFFQELQRLGLVEGQNLFIERRSAEGNPDLYDDIARDLINRKPEAIVVSTARMAVTFKRLTGTVPIIVAGADLSGYGLVESLSHPGGNVTGFSVDAGLELFGKCLQLLRELVPNSNKVGFLTPRSEWDSKIGQMVSTAARDIGVTLVGPPVEPPLGADNYRTALASMVEQGVDTLLVGLAAESANYARAIVEFVQEHRLPAVYPIKRYAQSGGLLTYASDLKEIGKGVARYVDLILKGARPSDLPVQQPVKFELIINLAAAKALGLTVPATMLASADTVIE